MGTGSAVGAVMDLRLLEPGDSYRKPQGCASANAPLWGYWHGAVTGMHLPLLRGASATYRQFWTVFVGPKPTSTWEKHRRFLECFQ